MKTGAPFTVLLTLNVASLMVLFDAAAAETPTNTGALRAGTNFIPTRIFSAEEDQKVLKAFEGLRVADVCDGMDAVGLQGRGLMHRISTHSGATRSITPIGSSALP